MFKVQKRFTDNGIRCAVNIDPIIPLITDLTNDIESILDNCHKADFRYVFDATLRLRVDIWERMKIILKMLHKKKKELKNIKDFSILRNLLKKF